MCTQFRFCFYRRLKNSISIFSHRRSSKLITYLSLFLRLWNLRIASSSLFPVFVLLSLYVGGFIGSTALCHVHARQCAVHVSQGPRFFRLRQNTSRFQRSIVDTGQSCLNRYLGCHTTGRLALLQAWPSYERDALSLNDRKPMAPSCQSIGSRLWLCPLSFRLWLTQPSASPRTNWHQSHSHPNLIWQTAGHASCRYMYTVPPSYAWSLPHWNSASLSWTVRRLNFADVRSRRRTGTVWSTSKFRSTTVGRGGVPAGQNAS